MGTQMIEYALRNKYFKEIKHSTVPGTYSIVPFDKFFIPEIYERDKACWQCAQFIIVTDCPSSRVKSIRDEFFEFAERNQYLIFSETNTVFNGFGNEFSFNEFLNKI